MDIRAHASAGWTCEADVVGTIRVWHVRLPDAGISPLLGSRLLHTVAQSDIDCDGGRDLPVVLNISAILPFTRQRRLQPFGKSGRGDRARQEPRKSVPCVGRRDTVGIQSNVGVQGEGAARGAHGPSVLAEAQQLVAEFQGVRSLNLREVLPHRKVIGRGRAGAGLTDTGIQSQWECVRWNSWNAQLTGDARLVGR